MGFNLLGALGGAVGGFFTGGPVGAVLGGIGGAESGTAPAAPPAAYNPLLPMIPATPDTISAQLGAGLQPAEDLTSAFDPSAVGDLSADSADAMASIADFS
jgi:hypothetical protein